MYFKIIYNLRTGSMTIRIPFLRTTSCFKSFLLSAIKAWNELPHDTKNYSSVFSFKSKLNKSFHKKDHGLRGENILQCQFRNKARDLNAHSRKIS